MRNKIILDERINEDARNRLREMLDQIPIEAVKVLDSGTRILPPLRIERHNNCINGYRLIPEVIGEFKLRKYSFLPEGVMFDPTKDWFNYRGRKKRSRLYSFSLASQEEAFSH